MLKSLSVAFLGVSALAMSAGASHADASSACRRSACCPGTCCPSTCCGTAAGSCTAPAPQPAQAAPSAHEGMVMPPQASTRDSVGTTYRSYSADPGVTAALAQVYRAPAAPRRTPIVDNPFRADRKFLGR